MKIQFSHILIFIVAAQLFTSCGTTNRLKRDGDLLIKNKVKIDNKTISKEHLEGFIQQKTNKKLFGILNFGVWIYENGKKSKDSLNWLQRNLGKKPILHNESLTKKSAEYMKSYLENIGYFHSLVDYKIVAKKKKAKVIYRITTNKAHKIKKIEYNISDSLIKMFVFNNINKSLLKENTNFNSYFLDDERERITNLLKERGYYFFATDYIYYDADSTKNDYEIDISLNIIDNNQTTESYLSEKVFNRYKIGDVFIKPSNDFSTAQSDTNIIHFGTKRSFFGADKMEKKPYHFIKNDDFKIRPKAILQSVFINPGDIYKASNIKKTYSNLFHFPIVKFVDIDVIEKKDSLTAGFNKLDLLIELKRKKLKSTTIEGEATFNAGDPGMALNLVYENRNIFRGAEKFQIKFRGALEAREDNESADFIFNSIETGLQASLHFPRFLLPIKPEYFSRNYAPSTSIGMGFNYQRRTQYERNIASLSLGYNWKTRKANSFHFNPIEISSVNINTTAEFDSTLSTKSRIIREQYSNHLVLASRILFSYKSSQKKEHQDYIILRFVTELAGSHLRPFNKYFNKDEFDHYSLFNTRYSEYIRSDIDIRLYRFLDRGNLFVYRTYLGVGIPYGNSDALPFEKGYFSGGANSLRGWRTRSVGPGGFYDPNINIYELTGDIKLEMNLEQRFPIYRFVKGAVFLDAGNIWLLKENSDFPEGEFNISKFADQLAIDAGLGIRFDFNYLIFRLDAGLPIHEAHNKNIDVRQWKQLSKIKFGDINWNIGIGYPF